MSLESPAKNYVMDYSFGSLTFTSPLRRKVSGGLVFLAIAWLAVTVWLVWFLFFGKEKISLDGTTITIMLFVGVVSILRVYPVVSTLVKQVFISEAIEATYQAIKVRRHIWGIGLTREYESEFISNLHTVQPVTRKFEVLRYGLASVNVQVSGPIILVYKNRNINLGFHLNYLEGREIVEAIHRSLPHYNKPQPSSG